MTDDTVTAKLAEWEALTEAATEGPWEAADHEGPAVFVPEKGLMHSIDYLLTTADEERGWSDAEFIAHARTAMPALIAAVKDVLALHVSSSESRGVGRVDPETGEWGAYCDHDGEWWPCPTIQALTKRLRGRDESSV